MSEMKGGNLAEREAMRNLAQERKPIELCFSLGLPRAVNRRESSRAARGARVDQIRPPNRDPASNINIYIYEQRRQQRGRQSWSNEWALVYRV